MAKLTRKQIADARKQAKQAREKAIEEIGEDNPELAEKQRQDLNSKKDKLGFTKEARSNIEKRISEIDKSVPKITWNFEEGDLVKLPCGSIGIIVENNAIDVTVSNYEHDMKKTLTRNSYAGKIYVVTSSGNNWYYPKQLKTVR